MATNKRRYVKKTGPCLGLRIYTHAGKIAVGVALHRAARQVYAMVGPPRGVFTTMNQYPSRHFLPYAQLSAKRFSLNPDNSSVLL
jgi:hypothetical protein